MKVNEPMKTHELFDAVNEFFNDTSRTASEVKEILEELIEEIEMKISSLPSDT